MRLEYVIVELRNLNEPVPKPMRLPTPNEVNDVEKQLEICFHPDYKAYLLKASDVVFGVLEPCTIVMASGHTDLFEVMKSARNVGVPKELIPICEDNGDYYCMDCEGKIIYWSHNGFIDESWPNLATWIKQVWINRG